MGDGHPPTETRRGEADVTKADSKLVTPRTRLAVGDLPRLVKQKRTSQRHAGLRGRGATRGLEERYQG